MTAETFQRVTSQGAWVDLSDRAKFLLTGADRVRYLNGQITNDVRKVKPDETLQGCVTNAKGRMEALVFVHSLSNDTGLLLDASPDLQEPLAARLEKYIVADDVELIDVTADWRLWHVFGEAAERVTLPGAIKSSRFGRPGLDLWVGAGESGDWSSEALSTDDAESWRILQGIPAWPQELNAEVFPPEAGLETSAMDFHKGCYIGQEVLSRIKTTGKMPRRLVRFRVPRTDFQVGIGQKLFFKNETELKEVGHLTSVTRHPVLDLPMGLAYVRHGVETTDSLLLAPADPPTMLSEVEIFPL
jgi:tRNA-modifying protein YgfZ